MKNKDLIAWLGKYGPSVHFYIDGDFLVAHDGKEWRGNLSIGQSPAQLGDPWED